MPIRLKITLLFTFVVMIIWALVCGGIYYFSYSANAETIRKRLLNRAITTSTLLQQSEIFDQQLIRRIDSSTTVAFNRKSVQVYRPDGELIYYYSEKPADTIAVPTSLIQEVTEKGTIHFKEDVRDVVGYHDPGTRQDFILICAAEDVDGKAALHQLMNILVLCFLGGTFVSFGGGYIFSRQLLKPVSRIAREVNDISVYSLDRRIAARPEDEEWYHLSTTLNGLLDRLKESFELQRRFISNASHELSTPLTLISSQIEISLQRHRSEDEYRRAMQSVLEDVRHMNQLVQTLLKFATAAGNAGGLNIDLVRVDEVLMRLPAEMKKKFRESVIRLQFNDLPADESTLLVLGNEELLFTAFSNIVSNACKYSPDQSATVSLTLNSKEFVINIIDKGIGIQEKELDRIFQPFYRSGEVNAIGGFGLGLSLASRIIKLHKGNIQVSSEPGKGSVFTISLPAAY